MSARRLLAAVALAGGMLVPLAAASARGGGPSSHAGAPHPMPPPKVQKGSRGCGCDAGTPAGHSAVVLTLVMLLGSRLSRRRRKA